MISQDEIVANAKTVTKGLEALRTEHETILGGIKASLATVEKEEEGGEGSLIQEKCGLMQRSLDMITLGLGEAHLMGSLATHLQNVEAEKQKLRSQVLKKVLKLKPKYISGEEALPGEHLAQGRTCLNPAEASGT